MSWKEYTQANETVADWLPWGGITQPHVVEGKDGSFFSVIRYQPVLSNAELQLDLKPLGNGWSLWLDRHHQPGQEDSCHLVLCWNPFINKSGGAANALSKVLVPQAKCREYFALAAETLATQLKRNTEARLLEYQEIIDYMAFPISMGEESIEMPEVPLYLDALLTQDLDISLVHNDITLGDKKIVIFTLPASLDDEENSVVSKAFEHVPFRHVKRFLVFGAVEAEKNMRHYMGKWCQGRKSIRRSLTADLIGEMNGAYSENYQLLVKASTKAAVEDYVRHMLDLLEVPYVIEDYNRKDVWWGSLPGLFRANAAAPQIGFAGLNELLEHTEAVTSKGKEALA